VGVIISQPHCNQKKGSIWRGNLLVVTLWQLDIRRACCYSSTAKAAKLSQQAIYRPSWADKSLPNGSQRRPLAGLSMIFLSIAS
jgi:hypothetical protein